MPLALKHPCEHGVYDEHGFDRQGRPSRFRSPDCPGGSLLPPDSLVIVKEDGEWPWYVLDAILATDHVEVLHRGIALLDALAAAQPGNT